VGPDHAREAVAVGDAKGGQAERGRRGEELLRMAGAAQEGIVGGDLQLGIGGGHGCSWRLVEGAAASGRRIST
jgi:hypothetical protein